MEQRTDDGLSPYRVFSRAEWAARREDTPMTLTPDEVTRVRSLHDRLDIKEVEDIYLPLTRLLSLYVAATQRLFRAQQNFLAPRTARCRTSSALAVRGRRQVDHRARAAGAAGALAERSQGRSGHYRRLSLSQRHSGARRPDGEERISGKLRSCRRCCGFFPT